VENGTVLGKGRTSSMATENRNEFRENSLMQFLRRGVDKSVRRTILTGEIFGEGDPDAVRKKKGRKDQPWP